MAQSAGCAKPGTVLQATGDVVLRKSPPQEKFLFVVAEPGVQIAKLRAGEKLTVKDSEVVSTLFRKDVWAKATTQSGISGWVYCGSTKGLVNFKIVE